ncbi:autotransporter domain-containing protein, partial [Escherichia coli]|uniref:autotransporter domain-containing protein n=1 Tax=Escherichia coli TaxID=562 RepID=UPI002034C190
LTPTSSGLWADIVAQGTRHSMKASSDNNDFRARGWGWLGSLETGLPFSIAYFHERRSLNNFHRDRVITFEQIAE